MKTCYKCKEEKNYEEFWKNPAKKDWHNGQCRLCQKEYTKQHYLNNKEKYKKSKVRSRSKSKHYVFNVLLNSCCRRCWETNPITLEFNHLNPKEKSQSISSMMWRSPDSIKKEMDKCEVLCSNCHARHTAKQQWRYSEIPDIEKYF